MSGPPYRSVGPTLFFPAMEQGAAFSARAALDTFVGLIAVAAFGVVYADWRCGTDGR